MVLSLNWVDDPSPEALEMRHAISRMVARRYRDHVEFTRALYLPNLALRLSHTLLRLMDQLGNEINYRGQLVGCLGPVVTQRDLGSMARGTRENVNKALPWKTGTSSCWNEPGSKIWPYRGATDGPTPLYGTLPLYETLPQTPV
jgi:hypothetical protein